MLEMIKVGNGPYDRSQIWDRIDARFFFEPRCSRSCFHGCLGVFCLICVLNVCLVCFGPGMAVDLSEPVFCDFPGIVNEGFTIPGIVF